MLVKTFGSAVYGIEATTITVEVNVSTGTKYYIVGLPDNAVKESLQRIESAIMSIGYRMPRQKVVVNLAPADIRKEGSSYDLSIAIGILAASNQINSEEIEKVHHSRRTFIRRSHSTHQRSFAYCCSSEKRWV